VILLSAPNINQGIKLNQAIYCRCSLRRFSNKALNLDQISHLLWAGGGKAKFRRTIPSAGATYPLEIYLIVGENSVKDLESGGYLYLWEKHALELKMEGDFRERLARACLGQDFIARAPVSILITAEYERTTSYYGKRGIRYVYMEVGHCSQNIYLEAVSLGLGTVVVGAFHDNEIKKIFELREEPLALMPVGYPE